VFFPIAGEEQGYLKAPQLVNAHTIYKGVGRFAIVAGVRVIMMIFKWQALKWEE